MNYVQIKPNETTKLHAQQEREREREFDETENEIRERNRGYMESE